MSNLREQTEALYEEYQLTIDKEVMQIIDQATQDLVASGIGQSCLQKSSKIKNFTLPDAYGKSVTLYQKLEAGPVVLSFYRGGWCTFCNLELKALQDRLADIHGLGAQLLAITPQKADGTLETLEELGIRYPILTDKGNKVARELGLVFAVDENLRPVYEAGLGLDIPAENGDDSYELPITATYVIDQQAVVVASFTDANLVNRFEPEEVISVLRKLYGECVV